MVKYKKDDILIIDYLLSDKYCTDIVKIIDIVDGRSYTMKLLHRDPKRKSDYSLDDIITSRLESEFIKNIRYANESEILLYG